MSGDDPSMRNKTEIDAKRLLTILEKVSVINRDNGHAFTDTGRLDAIASLLQDSSFHRIKADGLFHMYAQKPIKKIKGPIFVVSSHVDCERHITKCFTSLYDSYNLLGTYDNSITNAAIVYLMLAGGLPENVLVAFTGDEEENGHGALDVSAFIKAAKLDVRNIFVLDVSEEGWTVEADFTVENDFWEEDFGEEVIKLSIRTGYKWVYVPGDLNEIARNVPKSSVILIEPYDDESWDYDEKDIPCFSFCLPTKGEMHCDAGILARLVSFKRYTEMLGRMLTELK